MKRESQIYRSPPSYRVRMVITGIAILATALLVMLKAKMLGEFEWFGW